MSVDTFIALIQCEQIYHLSSVSTCITIIQCAQVNHTHLMQTYLSCSSSADTYIRLIHICLSLSSSLNVFIILNVFSKSITLIQCEHIYHTHPLLTNLSQSYSANKFIMFIQRRHFYHTHLVQTYLSHLSSEDKFITLIQCKRICYSHSMWTDILLSPSVKKLIALIRQEQVFVTSTFTHSMQTYFSHQSSLN